MTVCYFAANRCRPLCIACHQGRNSSRSRAGSCTRAWPRGCSVRGCESCPACPCRRDGGNRFAPRSFLLRRDARGIETRRVARRRLVLPCQPCSSGPWQTLPKYPRARYRRSSRGFLGQTVFHHCRASQL